ncbi:BTAD domain-containing putative transcriptional regulator [Micromonospora soli]|uniref:ATP-binding protein n=1 Tax=Micromonospora sp. NBRC 110009 TaxID=3061627 RepID=UPI002671DEEB|nr:AfsR/SARP family transcriptional regulator [Micromonospora sp. NBRC 110009]WKU00859.1 BTAD domain-containing putative transcriptional regulator [Micromonospora sp. NBRC 110009]
MVEHRVGALEIRGLGPVEVRVGAIPVDLAAAQLRTLLAALLLDLNRVVPAETLVDRLWSDKPVASARGSLQAYVSRLRRLLDQAGVPAAEVLATRPAGYLLALAEEAFDVSRFERAVRGAHDLRDAGRFTDARRVLDEGLALWRGPAYADIPVPAVRAEAVRLDEGRWSARELAAELDLALGRHRYLADELLAAVGQAPLRERLRGALMLALYRSGRQADALAVYVEGRRLLADELGVDPGRELQQLYERVLRQDPALDLPVAPVRTAAAAPAPAPQPVAPSRPPVVGRDDELARLDAALATAWAGATTVVTLTGEAGIGKTRLAEEAAVHATAAGALVVWGRCWEHEGAPDLWPWTQALRDVVGDGPEGRELLSGRAAPAALLLPDLGDRGAAPDATSPAQARAQLVDAVVALLASAGRRRPLLVVLEDLHWADQESLHLLELVAAHLRDVPVAIVATVRLPNDVTDDPSGHLLAGLARVGAHRVTLRGLGVDEVRTYIAEATGRTVSPEVASAVAARTDGNPFFITQVVRLGGPDAVLDDGVVPEGVREAVARRLRRVAPADRAVLEAAAVAGRVFDLPLLEAVSGVPAPTIDAAVDRALRSGLLSEEPAAVPRFRFAHALVQETLLAEVPRARRARLHDRAAAAVEARYPDSLAEHAAVLAHHLAASGTDPARCVRHTLLAAEHARGRWAFDEAERHLRAALDRVVLVPGQPGRELELQARTALGSLLTLALGYDAPAVAEQRRLALALSRAAGSVDDLLSALWGIWGTALVSGRIEDADLAVDQLDGAAVERDDAMLRIAALHARGQVRWHQGRLAEARAELEACVPLADRHAEAVRLDIFLQHPAATSRGWLSIVLAMLGRREESGQAAAAARRRGDELGDPYTKAYLQVLESWRRLWLDDAAGAFSAAAEGLAICREHGFAQLEAFSLGPLGWGRVRGGDPAGIAEVRTAVEVFAGAGAMFSHLLLGILGELELLAGRPAEALAAIDRGIEASDRNGEEFFLVELYRLRARTLDRLGDHEAAALAIRRGLEVGQQQGAALFVDRLRGPRPLYSVDRPA